ncbi:hypothetical protein PMAYCL1PPCAC_32690 [Pristionchus mayeri]|uniref:Uncharacterized protein n=1 Tax=Pristionchus mayeri TaxID=1317129 RepID=A0AAN5DGR6_9BILA|nr:hypothetical protein PMAYCL1PPCAC_32690 [Pristionchus mayeri]
MEITCNNFKEKHGYIENVIRNASFAAIDLEFLGLEDEEVDMKCSLFDSTQERYEKSLHSVRRFPPAQLGIALFTALEDGERYKVDVFTFYLFQSVSMGRDYSFSIASLSFLSEHGFDFNKLTREGISHVNLDELQRVLERFHQPNGIEIFGPHMPPLMHHLTRIIRSEVAKLRRRSTGSEGAPQHSFPGLPIAISQKLSDLQRAALLYKLHGCTPGIRCELQDQILMVHPCSEPPRDIKKRLFERLCAEMSGVSDIVMAIIERKLPIVGHNSFRDLLYIYEYFIADLPNTLDEFKRLAMSVFPFVADTKILAEECKNRLSVHGVMNYRLESLNAFFERMAIARRVASPAYDFDEEVGEKVRNPDAKSMHDAGVDAVSTGQSFLRLAHLVSMEDRDTSMCLPFKTLLYSVRPHANRLPVPLLGVPFINLIGVEPPSRNPEMIILEMIANDDEAGLNALRKELRGKFGRWRCDVRRHDDKRIHVATNTDTTYWRVYKYYSGHPLYRVLSVPSCTVSSSSSTSFSSSSPEGSIGRPAHHGSTTSVDSSSDSMSSDSEAPSIVCRGEAVDANNVVARASEMLFDLTPSPAVKWMVALGTCVVAANVLGRR